jgi:predicted RecB family nuclease
MPGSFARSTLKNIILALNLKQLILMQKNGEGLLLSATDLSNFLYCPHVTTLDLLLLDKKIAPPEMYFDATLDALIKKGEEFEAAYLNDLEAEGKSIARISHDNKAKAHHETLAAMQAGIEVIYQARLEHDGWAGWADFLLKVDTPSVFGDWSYEVQDTKFARHTKAGAILQISLYSYLLSFLQGVVPTYMHIRTPVGSTAYRTDEYMGYFRFMQRKLLRAIEQNNNNTYPEPVAHCEVCRWWLVCNKQRREDDHLSFIAGMGSAQRREVKKWGVQTLASMAQLPVPITHKPSRGSLDTFTRLREQARVQFETRQSNKHVVELLELAEDRGLFRLPEPSEGDLFFDFEGDPFVGTNGREYLFGWIWRGAYHHLWAFTEAEEKLAFEQFIDSVMQIRAHHPGMHIYHYSPYETGAIKRLMGKHASRENEVDTLLRAGVFVDLFGITRHAIRAGIESYSLKELEKLHNFVREQELRAVGKHKSIFETLLENGMIDNVDEQTKQVVLDYNREDCASTESLRKWLEKFRAELIAAGSDIPRPKMEDGNASNDQVQEQQRNQIVYEKLMAGLPPEAKDRAGEQQAKWLLAQMLDWYRRENKAFWWNYFRLSELPDVDLLDEREAIAGLIFTGRREINARSEVHYYTFPEQDAEMKTGCAVAFRGERIGSLFNIDLTNRILAIKKNKNSNNVHPTHIISPDCVSDKVKREAIFRVAAWVADNSVTGEGPYKAGRDLLLKFPPSPVLPSIANVNAQSINGLSEAQQHAINWVLQLREEVLPVQGPPGTGKSYTAARMIIELVRSGKQVGVTALSHKVITALLKKVNDLATTEHIPVTIVQKVSEPSGDVPDNWMEVESNDEVANAIEDGVNVAAGTSFMWAREEFEGSVDVLFVDEAGQLALIDTVALSHAGTNLVLLGDPQQLQQPQQGSHPEGTEVSALEHILGGDKTIAHDKGVLLDVTWRLHPEICSYTSALFYENRLVPRPENAYQQLAGDTKYTRPGIYIEHVTHEGNQNDSPEEVESVTDIIRELVSREVYFINTKQEKQRLAGRNIKVISPYNAQVNALGEAFDAKGFGDVEVGTVDKFQGQEAEVIIFSMATSSPEDAPRGMEFLYSLNRLNVAVSRARTVFILVATEALLQPSCKSPGQIRLANGLCSLVERAQ